MAQTDRDWGAGRGTGRHSPEKLYAHMHSPWHRQTKAMPPCPLARWRPSLSPSPWPSERGTSGPLVSPAPPPACFPRTHGTGHRGPVTLPGTPSSSCPRGLSPRAVGAQALPQHWGICSVLAPREPTPPPLDCHLSCGELVLS